MAILRVLKEPDPLLRRMALPVTEYNQALKVLLGDMVDTMKAENGVGLAAPQVGVLQRVLVMQLAHNGPVKKVINPTIVWAHEKKVVREEGCLSFPNVWAEVKRAAEVRVSFYDEHGVAHEELFSDFSAICIQHEMDHLNGVLFIDHLSPLKRTSILRKLRQEKYV